jgi:pimeloyl-ACP methyl ester carboxylesterase
LKPALRSALALALTLFAGAARVTPAQGGAEKTARAGIDGDWTGTLDAGETKLHLVLHLSRDTKGAPRATLDSPDQGVYGMEASAVFHQQATVSFEIGSVAASYQGKLSADGKYITGIWQQAGQGLALVFHRTAPGAGSRRPANAIFSVEGTWQGVVEDGQLRHRLQLHIGHDDKGRLTASLDSLDQGVSGLPATNVSEKGSTLHLEIPVASGTYDGTLNAAKNALTGTWTQNGEQHALNFRRSNLVLEARRPQNPQRPYPYDEEEVTFANAKAQVTLAGILTLPKGAGPFPAAVLISGSGPHDRDETIAGHKPFLVLADYLTRRGIAVLRYDKRGVGKSTGVDGDATTEDLAGDAEAAMAYLRSRKEIESRRIGLIGHSEGGMIAPMIAARGGEVAWMVLLAAPAMNGEKTLLKQSELIARAGGMSEARITQSLDFDRKAYAAVKEEKNRAALESKLQELVERSGLGTSLPSEALQGQIHAMSSPWFRYFLEYDPLPALERVKCPVLALSGEKDLQVPPEENLAALKKALEDGGDKDVTVRELPGLNHLFQRCNTGSPAEYGAIEETFSPEALQVIGDWVSKRVKP